MAGVEKCFGKTFRLFLSLINPFKKIIIKTEAKVHKYINNQALKILEEHGYIKQYILLSKYSEFLNKGVVWADQDFKTVNHFYNPVTKRGMYGQSNALKIANKYYKEAIKKWRKDDKNKAMFCLGACLHIIQDLTVPQHVNVKLLNNHKQYETYIKKTYENIKEFSTLNKPIIFDKIDEYVNYNSRTSLSIYKKYKKIKKRKDRFYNVTRCLLPLAQRTTAGCMLLFLKEVTKD